MLANLAGNYLHLGQPLDAEGTATLSPTTAKGWMSSGRSGNVAGVAESLAEVGTLRLKLGQFEAAIQEATEAVELSRQTGMRRNEAQALAVLGHAHRDRGDNERARQCWLDGIVIFTDLGHPQTAEVAADLIALEPPEPPHMAHVS